jgi:anti-sigma factor RsiW
MEFKDAHISDETLLMAIDGELPVAKAAEVASHVTACWSCRARRQEIEDAIAIYVRAHQRSLDSKIPAGAGPRAMLKARLAEMPAPPSHGLFGRGLLGRGLLGRGLPPLWLQVAAVGVIAAFATVIAGRWNTLREGNTLRHGNVVREGTTPRQAAVRQAAAVSVPDASLTPGATILASRNQVCSGSTPNNRAVPASLQRKVFEEYGIPGARSVAYEVDYLITPALGGADDIHNLWPQSYSETVWNARVKDALENRLRDLVCQGQLDLATAQRDIAVNWIDAYKKYFQTDRPLETANP